MTSSTRPVTRLLALPAALVLALSLAACSGDDDADRGDAGGASAGASPSAESTEGGTTAEETPLPEPPRVRRAEGAVADITAEECDVEAGDQTVTGSVTNSSDRREDYLITISWVDDTSNVVGRGFTVVKRLPSGDSEDWEVEAQVGPGATQCTQNVQRGRVRGQG